MRIFLIFMSAAVAACGCATTALPGPAPDVLASSGGGLPAARALLESGDMAGAVAAAERHTAESPGDPVGHFTLGTLLSANGDWDAAANALLECVTLDPDHGPAYNNLGLARLELADLTGARIALERARTLLPGDPTPLVNLAAVHTARGGYGTAAETLDEALMLAPKSPSVRLGLANTLARSGQRAQALSRLKGLADDAAMQHLATDIAIGLSVVLRQMGKAQKAVEQAERALTARPNDPAILVITGLAREALGEHEVAGALYKKALDAGPNNLDALYNYGAWLEERGNKDGARTHFQHYLELDQRPSARRGHVSGRLLRLNKPPAPVPVPTPPED